MAGTPEQTQVNLVIHNSEEGWVRRKGVKKEGARALATHPSEASPCICGLMPDDESGLGG